MRFFSRGHMVDADPIHRYGTIPGFGRNTIHASGHLDIEVDDLGRPTAVWFRCLNLPFRVWHRDLGEAAHISPDDMTILNIEYERRSDAQT